ncbi:MAG TPA: class I SAM-dependent DNA methyltransferase [Myxococcota bacterium]|nr:class I SAM-dependent DNA methyltransferase [Myxococcota bacterium]HQK51792.1 class I SAM-dependent DNA methyltransferase [Myxococcota bacterium]
MSANLSWNEIQARAIEFQSRWAGESSEDAEAKSFWNDFFQVFGVDRRRVASFETRVRLLEGKQGKIDCFWPGLLLIEHKSRGRDLDAAFVQAVGYFDGLKKRELPKYVLVSDFARFRLYDLDEGTHVEFPIEELSLNVKRFGFIAGYTLQKLRPEDPVNLQAAEIMGRLHDRLKEAGYDGHPLEVFLVRLLFCNFADDTGIFEAQSFREWIETRTNEDGSDLGARLIELFQVLNTPEARRFKNLDEQLAAFPYVNGKLFEEFLPIPSFDAAARELLLEACALDWGKVSPAILGALFQSIKDKEARRRLGEHYTSEANILKAIRPLFLDDLRAEFERIKGNRSALVEFRKKLRRLNILDPACGCGNFLVVAYRELRLLEIDVLRADQETRRLVGHRALDLQGVLQVDVDQFHGIEIEEFPARIAEVAMWLIDHQMNLRASEEFGQYFVRIPLKKSANIVIGNALRMDWCDVVTPERVSYIIGNPPFVGTHFLTEDQRQDANLALEGVASGGLLDYVCCWYVKAARYLAEPSPLPQEEGRPRGANVGVAFVSTNSITMGEQVGVLWRALLPLGFKIRFGHRTFVWSNEARGKAAVHCVIIGFGLGDAPRKTIFHYPDPKGEALAVAATNINPYLVDAHDILLPRRDRPLLRAPRMFSGNQPIDDGHYLFTPEEKEAFLAIEPQAAPFFRRWLGADEFLYGYERYCLWLGDCTPDQLRRMPEAMKRVDAVRRYRLASKRAATKKLADTPTRFEVEIIPKGHSLVLPEVSSEKRRYIPVGYVGPDTICSNLLKLIPDATLWHFGVLHSTMHMAWTSQVCGRLESRYRYSVSIVYNNFPWPVDPPEKVRAQVETAAQGVIDARARYPQSNLADLYDPLSMPPDLVEAHRILDRAVDAAYLATLPEGLAKPRLATDLNRVAFLFRLYEHQTGALDLAPVTRPGRRRTGTGRR